MCRMTVIAAMLAGSIVAVPAVAEMPGWLGVSVGPIPKPLAAHLRLEGQGVMVLDVVIGSPADAAGLKRPDLILSVDGTPVPGSAHALIDMMRTNRVGQAVTLEILRRGQRETINVTLASKPDEPKLRYRHGPMDEQWLGDEWPWGRVYRWGQDGWNEIDRDTVREKLRDSMRMDRLSPALRDRFDDAKRNMEDRLDAMERALRERGLYPSGDQPEPGSPPERMVARVVHGDTAIEITVDGERITVRRSDRDSGQQGETRVYDNPEMLGEHDPEAFGIYEKMIGPHRPAPPPLDWRQRLPSRDQVERGAAEALEQARERIDQLKQELRRQADRLDDLERVKEEFRRQADRFKDIASKVIRPDEPTVRFAVDPDGRIEATLRRGDGELVLRFKDEAQLAQRDPELHARFRELRQVP